MYQECFRYNKAEVVQYDMSQCNEKTGDIIAAALPVASEKLVGVLDALNTK